MTEAVVVALLALVGNVIVSYFSSRKSTALMIYRLDQLEGKVNKHNELIERTYELEKHMEIVEHQIDEMKHHE